MNHAVSVSQCISHSKSLINGLTVKLLAIHVSYYPVVVCDKLCQLTFTKLFHLSQRQPFSENIHLYFELFKTCSVFSLSSSFKKYKKVKADNIRYTYY